MGFYDEWCARFMNLFMKDFGGVPEDAAAVFGNAGEESGGFQSLQEKKPLIPGSKGGYGIMQWTGPRRRDFEAYCTRNNLSPTDMMTNYKFLFVELKGPEGRVLPKLFAAKGLEDKTKVFMETFLRPGIPHLDLRIKYAKRALKAWQDAKSKGELNIPEVPEPQKTPEASVRPPVSDSRYTKTPVWQTILDWFIDALFRKN